MLRGVGSSLVRGSLAASFERTYLGQFGGGVKFRTEAVQRPVFVQRALYPEEASEQLEYSPLLPVIFPP